MANSVNILKLLKTDLPLVELSEILAESQKEGFLAVQRLVDQWRSGANRFDQPGEALFVAQRERQIVGICGLNQDPYENSPSVGRVRHLYVRKCDRRQGVGQALVGSVIMEAIPVFKRLHLRTFSHEADLFYQSLGFKPCCDRDDYTHVLRLEKNDGIDTPPIEVLERIDS